MPLLLLFALLASCSSLPPTPSLGAGTTVTAYVDPPSTTARLYDVTWSASHAVLVLPPGPPSGPAIVYSHQLLDEAVEATGRGVVSMVLDDDAVAPDEALSGDVGRALAALKSLPGVDPNRLALVNRDRVTLLSGEAPEDEVVESKDQRQSWLFGRWGLRVPGPDLIPTLVVKGPKGNYRLGTTELTQGQWKAVTGRNQAWFSTKSNDYDQYPIEMVNWYQAVAFCNALSTLEGLPPAYVIDGQTVTLVPGSRGWRLPTSEEWEWAAQGGALSHHTDYAGSNNLDEVGWTWDNAGETTHPVGLKKPNELGFYDMSGNVREWCWDIGIDDTSRIYRGGGFISGARFLRIDYVDDFLATYLNNDNGLRLARTVD